MAFIPILKTIIVVTYKMIYNAGFETGFYQSMFFRNFRKSFYYDSWSNTRWEYRVDQDD